VKQELETAGYHIKNETYKSNLNGEVAIGIYQIASDKDEDLDLMFAWANSYDKTRRFRCSIGAVVKVCMNGMMKGDMADYGRKHVGDAKDEVKNHIRSQISSCSKHFGELIQYKNWMKVNKVTSKETAQLLGTLYLNEIITVTQLVNVKSELEDPSYFYNSDQDSFWTLFNHITLTLKKSHPKAWMDSQIDVLKTIISDYMPAAPATVDPAQLDLAVEAEKMEESFETEQVTDEELDRVFPMPSEEEEVTEELNQLLRMSDDDIRATYDGILSEEEIDEMIQLKNEHNTTAYSTLEEDTENTESEVVTEVGEPSEEEKKEMMEAYQDDIENGEYPYVDEDGVEIVEEIPATEEEVNHMLHGVDNNPEVVISESSTEENEHYIDRIDELPEDTEDIDPDVKADLEMQEIKTEAIIVEKEVEDTDQVVEQPVSFDDESDSDNQQLELPDFEF
jgi:hypothetical protein